MTTAHKETGGPAFPVPTGCGEEWGMTLRDYFAAKAMQGFATTLTGTTPVLFGILACDAYTMADEMLKARNKR